MLDGRVTVNGVTVRELGTKADATRDDVRVDGRRVAAVQGRRYLLLNKPRGYVTTRSDPQKRPTVLDLLGSFREYVYPVGRLDFDSEGLMLLTNDGDLAARLTHPRYEVPREYEVQVLGVPDDHDLQRLARGVLIEGRRAGAVEARRISDLQSPRRKRPVAGTRDTRFSTLQIVLKEGRNRQVRKMCDAIGHPVERLRRVAIGPIRDNRLRAGQWRDLTPGELARLRQAVADPAGGRRPPRA
jgi:pseudouridine synthase